MVSSHRIEPCRRVNVCFDVLFDAIEPLVVGLKHSLALVHVAVSLAGPLFNGKESALDLLVHLVDLILEGSMRRDGIHPVGDL